ncbi:hypothetical protein CF392_07955 [Tamilnaduibacter salinus]|uniref:DUF721 domain-containing protein n=1 Tax=Tamilnaduibacter salinus TaxID=1484056 RepID=A0A2A2I4T3_9GAMM|nr:DciA family protein [Tamilnaduibacter salinus]PAV26033.1 hypothetical protein CF392_07955 [Tamilnaduibacter salinus]
MKPHPSRLRLNAREAPGATLERLLEAAEHHQALEQRVLTAIPAELASGCRFVAYRDGDLTLSAPNSVHASQLRLRQRDVVNELRQDPDFRHLWRLKVRVVPQGKPPAGLSPAPPISTENARLLMEEAGHTKDEDLRQVLERLARHARD